MGNFVWIKKNVAICRNSLRLLLEMEKVMRRAKRREELFRAGAWRGPLFILPFWAEGDRRVSHATRRRPAGYPRKGAIAASKEGQAIGINYSEWRGLCLQFSPLFSKRSHRGKEFNPNHRLSASLLERFCLPSHQFNIPPSPPPCTLPPHLLWNAPGICCPAETKFSINFCESN